MSNVGVLLWFFVKFLRTLFFTEHLATASSLSFKQFRHWSLSIIPEHISGYGKRPVAWNELNKKNFKKFTYKSCIIPKNIT